MKEQPLETQGSTDQQSVGQRPIHVTYEPPGPIPQFRPRPKLRQAQAAVNTENKRRVYPSPTARRVQNISREVPTDAETGNAKKSN